MSAGDVVHVIINPDNVQSPGPGWTLLALLFIGGAFVRLLMK